MPHFAQLFVAETIGARADAAAFGGGVAVNGVTRLERRAFVLRKRAERAASRPAAPSTSSRCPRAPSPTRAC
jgi:glutamate synthase (NADPH/NADH) large chain